MFERVVRLGTERAHAARAIERLSHGVGFEIQPAFVNDSEERLALVETMPAEHRFADELGDLAELIQDKLFETVATHAPRTFRRSSVDVDRSSLAA